MKQPWPHGQNNGHANTKCKSMAASSDIINQKIQ